MHIAVCWMLTDTDNSNDGKKRDYVDKLDKLHAPDPLLFEWMTQIMADRENRSVSWIRNAALIPHAVYYDPPLMDGATLRRIYFERFLSFAAECDLAFFDADKGLENSRPQYGLTGSSQYLYENELVQTYEAGLSVLAYQSYGRDVTRPAFLERESLRLRKLTGAAEVIAFRTSFTSFLLVPQPRHLVYLRERSKYINDVWAPIKGMWLPYITATIYG